VLPAKNSGFEVSVYYDPILSKLITWAPARDICCYRMAKALEDFPVLGIKTDIEFLRDVVIHPEFLAGNTYTDFIPRNMPEWKHKSGDGILNEALIAAALYSKNKKKKPAATGKQELPSPWLELGSWQIGSGV
jgi:acetyl/propionyl-CoA carboxylase alpha subunit